MRKEWFTLIVLLGVCFYFYYEPPAVTHGPGVLVPRDPIQTQIQKKFTLTQDDYTITPLANFQIQALVLGIERYRFGRESDLSPVDFAMGWGPMSNASVLEHIKISQRNRWYYYRYSGDCPISKKTISRHSANMHLIPANDKVRVSLKAVREGHVVALDGYLVEVEAKDDWRWKSSLTRNDSGDHSCELIWVENIKVVQKA